MSDSVAVLGAGGTMGAAMARNLLGAGFDVRAWNRTRERAEALASDGATVCDTPAQAAEGAAFVLTMLSDADAVLGAMDGVSGEGATWLQMSTIGLEGSERCAALADGTGLTYVDAPVLGTKAPAENGELVVLASGPDDARERVQPVFDAVGKATIWAGEAGAGSRLKLAANAWLLAIVEGAAESLALAEGMGIDPSLLFDAVGGGPLDLPYLQTKGRAMLARDFEPSFRLALAAKDAGLVEDAARAAGLSLPLAAAVAARFREGAQEHGDEDLSATYLLSAPDGA